MSGLCGYLQGLHHQHKASTCPWMSRSQLWVLHPSDESGLLQKVTCRKTELSSAVLRLPLQWWVPEQFCRCPVWASGPSSVEVQYCNLCQRFVKIKCKNKDYLKWPRNSRCSLSGSSLLISLLWIYPNKSWPSTLVVKIIKIMYTSLQKLINYQNLIWRYGFLIGA